MKTAAIMATAALLTFSHAGFAQQPTPSTETTPQANEQPAPGTEATGAMSDQVPQMKPDCPETTQVDTKAPGTEATEAMSEQVPTMTADSGDCVDKNAQKKTN